MLTTHLRLAPKLRMSVGGILVLPIYDYMVRTGVALPSSFLLLTRLRAGRGGFQILAEARDLSLQNDQTGSVARLASYTMGAGGCC